MPDDAEDSSVAAQLFVPKAARWEHNDSLSSRVSTSTGSSPLPHSFQGEPLTLPAHSFEQVSQVRLIESDMDVTFKAVETASFWVEPSNTIDPQGCSGDTERQGTSVESDILSPYPGQRKRSSLSFSSQLTSFCCDWPVVEAPSQDGVFASLDGVFARQLSGMSNSSAGDVSLDDLWTVATPAPEKQIVLQKDKLNAAMVRIAGIARDIQVHIKSSRRKRRSRIQKSHSWHAGDFADFEKTSSSAPQQEAESDTEEEQDISLFRKTTSLNLIPDIDLMPEVPMMRQKQGVVIFDWDDTLFPSWHLAEVIQPCLPADHKYAQLKHDSVFYDSMRAHGTLIRSLFEIVCSYAHVQIVTLGMRPWVEDSAEWFLPELNLPALLEEYDIQIYYAREHVSRAEMRAAVNTEGVDLYSVAKRNAMMKCMTDVFKKDIGMEMKIANVIAVGDSPAEIEAIQELMWSFDSDTNFCKTIKLLPEPTLQVLTMQLEVLKSWLGPLISFEDDADIDFGREDDPRTSRVVKSLLAAST